MPAPHCFCWTQASIRQFWEFYEASPGMDLWHFTRQRGGALLRHVQAHTPLGDPVLDLGCGSGFLLDLLLRNNHRSFTADVNTAALEIVTRRFNNSPFFLGARLMTDPATLPFEDNSIATIFLLETIEHLMPESIEQLFTEIARVLRRDGNAVVTAPYQEDLHENTITCTACGAQFHKTQHIRSIDETVLSALMATAGLNVVSCKPTLLLPDWGIWIRAQLTAARATVRCPECGNACSSPNRHLLMRWKGLIKELRHLVCIARSPR